MLLRDTYAEIDSAALRHNVKLAQKIASKQKIIAVVKANAYGHGMLPVVDILIDCGIDLFGVATLSEAIVIKKQRPDVDVIVLGHTPNRLLNIVSDYAIIQTIFNLEQAEILNNLAKPCRVHIKIDSGLHRLGFATNAATVEAITKIAALKNIIMEGVFSHLALGLAADDHAQYAAFTNILNQLKTRGISFKYRHICDSIAFTRYPQFQLDMVRLGAWLFGMKGNGQTADLKEVLSLKSRISHISIVGKGEGVSYDYLYRVTKKSRIATIPIGYGDGYPRNMSSGGYVMIDGKPAEIAGVINMDQMMVNLKNQPNAQVGDEVIIYGASAGLPIGEIARIAQTNKNEILSRLAARVPRIYR